MQKGHYRIKDGFDVRSVWEHYEATGTLPFEQLEEISEEESFNSAQDISFGFSVEEIKAIISKRDSVLNSTPL